MGCQWGRSLGQTKMEEGGWLTGNQGIEIVVVQPADVLAYTEAEGRFLIAKAIGVRNDDGALKKVFLQLQQTHPDVGGEAGIDHDRMFSGRKAIRKERRVAGGEREKFVWKGSCLN